MSSTAPARTLVISMAFVVNVCIITGSGEKFQHVILQKKKKERTIELWNFLFSAGRNQSVFQV